MIANGQMFNFQNLDEAAYIKTLILIKYYFIVC